jgi:hypothetical protein
MTQIRCVSEEKRVISSSSENLHSLNIREEKLALNAKTQKYCTAASDVSPLRGPYFTSCEKCVFMKETSPSLKA